MKWSQASLWFQASVKEFVPPIFNFFSFNQTNLNNPHLMNAAYGKRIGEEQFLKFPWKKKKNQKQIKRRRHSLGKVTHVGTSFILLVWLLYSVSNSNDQFWYQEKSKYKHQTAKREGTSKYLRIFSAGCCSENILTEAIPECL